MRSFELDNNGSSLEQSLVAKFFRIQTQCSNGPVELVIGIRDHAMEKLVMLLRWGSEVLTKTC